MPKMKTSRAAAKRFKKTGTGKLVRNKAYKSHILTKKSTKGKRNLRKDIIMDATNAKVMKKISFSFGGLLRQNVGLICFTSYQLASTGLFKTLRSRSACL